MLLLRPYEVELLRPARGIPPLSWALLGLGLLSLAWAALACRPAWEHHSELAAEETRLQGTLDGLAPHGANRGSGTAKSGKARDHDALAEGEAALAEMQRPWPALFNQLEAAVDADGADIHVVQLSVDPHFASLQLVAEGRDLDALVRFAQHMAGNGPISRLTMTHHEWHDSQGAHVVSASMKGDLDDTPRPAEPMPPASASQPAPRKAAQPGPAALPAGGSRDSRAHRPAS